MTTPEQRRLAAIVFTDMVGFSALSQRDEALALRLLEEHRRIVRGFIAKHDGREVKTTGDGFLLEFSSALSAARAAVEIQQALHARNETEPAGRQIQIRIGVHVGDVIVSGGDIHGDGVNIAARLEPLAPAGGICVSNTIFDQVRNKLAQPLAAMAPTELKNITLPITVYRVVMPWDQAGPRLEATAPTEHGIRRRALAVVIALLTLAVAAAWAIWRPWSFNQSSAASPVATPLPERSPTATGNSVPRDEKSVAVLAFSNLSDDKANEYFADGVSEELLNVLAQVPGLKVSARTSAFHFKGKDTSIPEIARQLGVAYVVEGSVRKSGDKVRITAQLIKAADGFHVWSDTFTRDLKDVFATQDEIAGLIARNLQLKFDTTGKVEPAKVNPDAYRLYLEGRREWNQRSPDSLLRAQVLFEQALAMEPGFARAHVGLADTFLVLSGGATLTPRTKEFEQRAEAAARAALKLDPNLGEAYATLGSIESQSGNWDKADNYFRTAIKLNPNYSSAHHWYGLMLIRSGNAAAGLAELERSVELDPLAPIQRGNLALVLLSLGQPGRALDAADSILKIQPDFQYARSARAQALFDLGKKDEAIAEYQKLLEVDPRQVPGGAGRAAGWAAGLAIARGRTAIEEYLARLQANEPDRHHLLALLLAQLGRYDEALPELEAASKDSRYSIRDFLDRAWDPLGDDPRFRKILESAGLTKAYDSARAYAAAHPESAGGK